MKILIVDTYYDKFLETFYKKNPTLKNHEYDFQLKALLNTNFGTSDTYSYYLNKNNWEAKDLIVNSFFLQEAWGKNNDIKMIKLYKNSRQPRVSKYSFVTSDPQKKQNSVANPRSSDDAQLAVIDTFKGKSQRTRVHLSVSSR